jgi:hypothetical protein
MTTEQVVVRDGSSFACLRCYELGKANGLHSGFYRPIVISDALIKFFRTSHKREDIHNGDLMTRVDVTKLLSDYIVKHDLRHPEKHNIICYEGDPEFSKLLNMEGIDVLTYFSLQNAIKHHFNNTGV